MEFFGNYLSKCTYVMVKKTPVSVYRLLSSPSNKHIVLVSFQKTPCMSTVEEIQSAPENLFLLPHGRLHLVTISCHMEYSIWWVFGAISSTLGFRGQFLLSHGVLNMAAFLCHMEYSMWSLFHTIWEQS